jgi:hypothetical protein
LDLNHLRHGTRMLLRPLRRPRNIRINSHNVSEHSPSDLEAPSAASPSRGCRRHERFPGQTSAERRPSPVPDGPSSETSDNRQPETDD